MMRGLTLAALCAASLLAQGRSVAITVDDLPYAGAETSPTAAAKVNGKLLAALRAHHAPATGFVVEQRVQKYGAAILKRWTGQGFDLGNHSYSHPDINPLSVEQVEEEIVGGERTIGRLAFFRFPMNHTGDTKEKHEALAAFLTQRGYQLATCTIDTSDYVFNDAYEKMLAKKDSAAARKLRAEYLAYTSTEIDYYASLNKQVLGYEPPEVMLLHVNRLNSDVIDAVLRLFEEKHYRFVSLAEAQSDAAYRTPSTFVTPFGPMWGYRWARERQVKVNGALEKEPPQWIVDYGKK